MRLARVLAVLSALLVTLLPATASATDAPAPTTLVLSTRSTSVTIDNSLWFTATLATPAGPVAGEPVRFERLVAGTWQAVGQGTTGSAGTAVLPLVVPETTNSFRAVYDGGPSYTAATSAALPITGTKRSPELVIGGATSVVDEHAATITAGWRLPNGTPVAGAQVRLYALPKGAANWSVQATTTLGSTGLGSFTIRPRVDTRYRLYGLPGRWWNADISASRFVDNLPPGKPWHAPAAAPRPQSIAPQPRAWGAGAHVLVSTIPDNVWDQMTGISWHRGCPVGRSGLRLVATNYWGFDGYRHRGALVVNAAITSKYVGALRDLYTARIPIRAMYRVDRFGYSSRSGGGDDFASMAHDNTSAFNCRWVTGSPGVRSPHATGRAWDIDTWENPYHSQVGWLPDGWWVTRSDPRVAWRSSTHQVVRILRANGFRWTYAVSDSQHFDGRVAEGAGATFSG